MQSPLASERFTDVMSEDENEEKSLVLVVQSEKRFDLEINRWTASNIIKFCS